MVEMDALPEECIAHIISLTTPRDAARFSAVSRAFRSASDSDAAWHKFLPRDLDLIVSTSSSSPRQQPQQPPLGSSLTRKKDVFLRLCSSPLLIDSGRKFCTCKMEREEVLYDWLQRSVYSMGLGYSLLEMEFTPRLKIPRGGRAP